MSTVSTDDIKKLRDDTSFSVMQCKQALEEADGDYEKALDILKVKGAAIAKKKGDRDLGAGVVASYIHATGTIGTLIELDCETDFVARNDDFKTLARDIAMHISATTGEDVAAILEESFVKNPDQTVQALIESGTQKFGERIELTQFTRYRVGG